VLRTDQRRAAVWALYQSDLLGRPLDETHSRDAHAFTRALAQLVRDRQAELDELISTHASGWSLDRIAPLERSILRVGLVEMLHPEQIPGEQPIPPEGAIDEAVETAKQFCGADAPAFVNGILGAVLREREARPGERGAVPGEREGGTILGSAGDGSAGDGSARADARSG
jgi:N utilization substance protein B